MEEFNKEEFAKREDVINVLLNDHQTGHSEFQDDYFITGKSGGNTIYGQYKQALRELYKRMRGLNQSLFDREKLEVEIEEQEWISKNDPDQFKRRYADIELRRKKASLEESDRVIFDTERELERFYAQAVALKVKLGLLTPELRNEYEKEMWIDKFKEMTAIDLATTGRIGTQTYELLTSLPSELKHDAYLMLKEPDKIIGEFENKKELITSKEIKTIQGELKMPDFKQLSFDEMIKKIDNE